MPDKRLFLIDGMAILFRSFYAMYASHLTSKSGEPTGATFGFASALVRIIDKHKPDLIAVAWDTAEPTFRHEQFTAYKANRAEFPEELVPQLERVKEVIGLYHIPQLEIPGYEADDVIGALACRAADDGYMVYCVTPDKDYLQLVRDNLLIYKPSRPGADEEIVGYEGVHAKFGVTPDRVIDVLALIGDASDNVPGVKGIGEKTAIPLIQQFGSLEALYENIEKVEKPGVRKKLLENRDAAFMSKDLVTIRCDIPIDVSYEQLRLDPPDIRGLLRMYDELGFKSLAMRYQSMAIDEIPEESEPAKPDGDLTGDAQEPDVPPENRSLSFDFHLDRLKTIADVEHTYVLVRTEEQLATLVEYAGGATALTFDLETDGLDSLTASIVGVSLAVKAHEAFYVPVANEAIRTETTADGELFGQEQTRAATEGLPLELVLGALRPLLERADLPKVGQNAKFDMLILRRYGIRVVPLGFDTMLASYVLDSSKSHGMDALSERLLNYTPISIKELIGPRGKEQISMREVPLEAVAEYAAEDSDVTLQLYTVLQERLREEKLIEVAERYEFPLVSVLTEMEHCGVAIDVPALREISASLEETMKRIEIEVFELAGHPFNIGSPKQLATVLFEELKLPSSRKTKTGYSTDQWVMEDLAALHPLPEKILAYRQAAKLKGTYVDALPGLIAPSTGRIHTSYNQAVAATGRLSSNNPNLQNIPIRSEMGQEIRKAFVPGIPDAVLLSADYSQIELRLMAFICGDEALVTAFKENFDVHTATAMNVFGCPKEEVTPNMRRKAKEVNFGIMYGIGPFGLARRLKIPKAEAQTLITTYFQKYPGVQQYIGETVEKARALGYVETLSGRRRYYPNINSRNASERSAEERAAINMPIQGTAADVIKLAMIDIHREIKGAFPEANMLLQVHDELVFEVPERSADALAAFVKEKMETAFPIGDVPLVAETGLGRNWLEAH
ncbi:MAG TPA: DNA polymerase I [Candidatus Kapabacteria bacterium]|nr:DNA polymerase I [Candidatus Kapabacteria bacterium]